MRVKRFSEKSFQVRLPVATERKLKAVADRSGCDQSTILRLALHSGLTSIAKNLPPTPPVEEVSND
jgi:hypothetical protein